MNWRTPILILLVGAALAAPASGSLGPVGASGAYRAYIVSAARDGLAAPSAPHPDSDLPPLPPGWPTNLELGYSDSPGGATVAAARGFGFRYQYLAGGVNTGNGWKNWQPDGRFVTHYAEESWAAGIIPVFSYYMVRQSLPGANNAEQDGVRTNLHNTATMRALFDDLSLAFSRMAGTNTVVFHFEPDLWGYLQADATNDDGATSKVSVASSGHPDVQGLPDSAAGLAQALVRLRDAHAPNVLLAYHLSTWGTGVDPLYANPNEGELAKLVDESVAFYRSLGAGFDLAFGEMGDRDSGFKHHVYGDGGASWWDEGDFERHAAYVQQFVQATGLRLVLWQIPYGNTKMRSVNNTWNHYQDNKVEWLLGDTGYGRLAAYRGAGVIALLFGRGADGATCACDGAGDGVTNPAPINGNDRVSASADDDGGYFAEQSATYLQSPLPLPR